MFKYEVKSKFYDFSQTGNQENEFGFMYLKWASLKTNVIVLFYEVRGLYRNPQTTTQAQGFLKSSYNTIVCGLEDTLSDMFSQMLKKP